MRVKWSERFAQEVTNNFRDAIGGLSRQHSVGACAQKDAWLVCDCRLATQIRLIAAMMQEWSGR